MAKIGNYPATNKQVEIFNESMASHTIFEDLVWKALEALDEIHSLPHVNEDGERIVGGANKRMRYTAETYFNAAQALRSFFPRKVNIGDEYFPFMYLRCRMNGLVHSWIASMVAENGGKPPRTWDYSDTGRHSQFKTEETEDEE